MTPEERAEEIVGSLTLQESLTGSERDGLADEIASAIRSVVLEERERCAGILREAIRSGYAHKFETALDDYGKRVVRELETAIRQEAGGERDGGEGGGVTQQGDDTVPQSPERVLSATTDLSAPRGETPKPTSCNRHSDCNDAEQRRKRPGCCRDDCCEDCFGS